MLQVIEELEERYLGLIAEEVIFAHVGKNSGKLYGFKICTAEGVRHIYFHDIEKMKQILDTMCGQ